MALTSTSFTLTYKVPDSDPSKAGRAIDEWLDGAATGDGRWTAKKGSVNFWEYSGNWEEDYSPYNMEVFAQFLSLKYPSDTFEITGVWNSSQHGGYRDFIVSYNGKAVEVKQSPWHISHFVSDIFDKYASPEEYFRKELGGADEPSLSKLRKLCADYKKNGSNPMFYVDCEGSKSPYFEQRYEK